MNVPDGNAPKSGLSRWIRILALGVVLGLVFVFINLSIWTFLGIRSPNLRRSAPFKLSLDPTRRELSNIVGSQLDAFRKNDYSAAYGFAAAPLKERLSTAGFEQMVKSGYPAIARSQDAGIGMILDNGDEALVDVSVKDDAGKVLRYRYVLIHESAGWKIGGVMKVQGQGTVL